MMKEFNKITGFPFKSFRESNIEYIFLATENYQKYEKLFRSRRSFDAQS